MKSSVIDGAKIRAHLFHHPSEAGIPILANGIQQLGHDCIGAEHLLLGLIHDTESSAMQMLTEMGADMPRIREPVSGADPRRLMQVRVLVSEYGTSSIWHVVVSMALRKPSAVMSTESARRGDGLALGRFNVIYAAPPVITPRSPLGSRCTGASAAWPGHMSLKQGHWPVRGDRE